VGFDFSALHSREMKTPGGGPRLESGWRSGGPRIQFSVSRRVESEPVRWQAPPRKRTGARERAGAQDLHSLPLATTQLVDGACLIRRYRAVRSRGGQPWLTLATAGRWPSRLRQLPYMQKMRRFKPCPPHRRVGVTVISPGPQPGDCRFKSGTRRPWPHRPLARIRPLQGREDGSEPSGATNQSRVA
jgi:hypothetical protein